MRSWCQLLLSIALGVAVAVGAVEFAGLVTHAQTPALYSVEINGVPISGNAPINFVAQPGILFGSPQLVNGATQVTVTPDSALLLDRPTDQAGTDHTLVAISNGSGLTPGLVYGAATMPPLAVYTAGQWFVVIPDQPTQPGATINIGGVGPLPIQGTCAQICILLAVGAAASPAGPATAMVVH
jgi:hypothetical protein